VGHLATGREGRSISRQKAGGRDWKVGGWRWTVGGGQFSVSGVRRAVGVFDSEERRRNEWGGSIYLGDMRGARGGLLDWGSCAETHISAYDVDASRARTRDMPTPHLRVRSVGAKALAGCSPGQAGGREALSVHCHADVHRCKYYRTNGLMSQGASTPNKQSKRFRVGSLSTGQSSASGTSYCCILSSHSLAHTSITRH
jgi:hypothetical protein